MKTYLASWTKTMLFVCSMLMFTACNSSEPMGQGQTEFQITGAPTDNQNIKGVFITVSQIKVDGVPVAGFTKQTFDLKSYQEGNTKLLGTGQLDAKGFDHATFVLDTDFDADGNSPGCYVLTTNGEKFKLRNSGKIEVAVDKSWKVVAGGKSTMVLDFDIRKSIQEVNDPAIRYSFLSDDHLNEAVRMVNKDITGTISGTYSDPRITDERIVVYAYEKGTFNESSETQPQGENGILFKNAVATAEIKSGPYSRIYTLALLEEGGYELHFAGYQMDAASQRFVFHSLLDARTSIGETNTRFINVKAGATTSPDTMILHSAKDNKTAENPSVSNGS